MAFPHYMHSSSLQSREQDLAFITVSEPDHLRNHETQKKIRHHVMSQVGRSRKKKPKFTTVTLELIANTDDPLTANTRNYSPPDIQENPSVPQPLFPYGIYAVDPTPRARELIHFSMYAA